MRRHADRTLPVHELVAVQAGTVPITECDRPFLAGPGDWLLLRAGRRHFGSADLGPDAWFYWICFDDSYAAAFRTTPQWRAQIGRVARPDRLRGLFEDLLDDQSAATLTPSMAAAYLELMVAEILRRPPVAPVTPATDLAERARALVHAQVANPGLSTSQLAGELACAPDHLGRAFRATFGETVTSYIHRQRVERARMLFRTTGYSIETVAAECGFTDIRYFRRIFGRHVGLTPREFRRIYPLPPS